MLFIKNSSKCEIFNNIKSSLGVIFCWFFIRNFCRFRLNLLDQAWNLKKCMEIMWKWTRRHIFINFWNFHILHHNPNSNPSEFGINKICLIFTYYMDLWAEHECAPNYLFKFKISKTSRPASTLLFFNHLPTGIWW